MARFSLEIGNSNQELMEKSNRRNWKVWLVALVLFIVIIVLVAAAVVLLTGIDSEGPESEKLIDTFTLEHVMTGKLSPNRFNGTWISDDQFLYLDEEGSIRVYDAKRRQGRELLSADHPIIRVSFDHQVSPDKKYILFAFEYHKLYRHSYTARYLAIDLETKDQILIQPNTNESFFDLVLWGPQGNSLIYVQNNNVFYKRTILSSPIQLSFTGIPRLVYNGVPDWVYEEEIFASNKALWFSEDGSHVAFAKFNDSQTRIMAIPYYGSSGNIESQYPRTFTVRYPKSGTVNPDADLYIADLTNLVPTPSKLSKPMHLNDPILASVSFVNNSAVAAVWMNRVQNESVIIICDQICKEVFHYKEQNGWVDMLRPLVLTSNGKSFFTILPKKIGNDSWRQIAMISEGTTNEEPWSLKFITSEETTVTEITHWDDDSKTLWFLATEPKDFAVQHLYTVTLDGKINCFTCKIKHTSQSDCLYNEVSMSKSGSYLVVSCMGPQIPEIYLYTKNGEKISDWDKNDQIVKLLKDKAVPIIKRLQVQIAPAPLPPAQVLLMIPPNVDLSGSVKLPMLVNVYGGPDSYQVLEKWNMDWGSTLVMRHKVVVALIDGRGSGLKGNNNLFAGYRKLGTVEVNDQINVTRRLQYDLGYIDSERTCIWGWSYGGYAAALALARGGNTFTCAISVAPVTDWLYYDSIYTERYMGLPTVSDNYEGYVQAQLNTHETALALDKKKFMLIHGTLDDNVHYQQSMMLSRLLQINDILFTQLSYPDEDHGLNGVKKHLYHSIEQFLLNNLIKHNET